MDKFEIVAQDNGDYQVQVKSLDDATSITLILAGADDLSEGQLADDVQTARAAIRFLLTHQDANDLPYRLELGDILAAYPDAIEGIKAQRG